MSFNKFRGGERKSVPTYRVTNFGNLVEIGSGGEAVVYRGTIRQYGQVAIKMYIAPFSLDDKREVKLAMELSSHPNICTVYGLVEDFRQYGFFMEYFPMGSLDKLIHNFSERYSWSEICDWIEQICRGLQHLHNAEIIHRDIKPANVMLVNRGHLKIVDFETARIDSVRSHMGTYYYMAPEVIETMKYNLSADFFTLTITFWKIIHRKHPYMDIGVTSTFRLMSEVINGLRPNINDMLPIQVTELLNKGWHSDPEQRPSLEDFSKAVSQIRDFFGDALLQCDYRIETSPNQQAALAVEAKDYTFTSTVKTFVFSSFKNCEIKAKGGEAFVYKGWLDHYGDVGIKQYYRTMKAEEMKEVEMLIQHARHQNIVQLLGILVEDSFPFNCAGYVMQWMPNGSLDDVIHDLGKAYSWREASSWIRQMSFGLRYLHDEKIIHRDIKPLNMLMDAGLETLKISDFGLARTAAAAPLTAMAGTTWYIASEVYETEKYSYSSDIYACAITVWEIVCRQRPYCHLDPITAYCLIKEVIAGTRPLLDDSVDKTAVTFLERAWSANPDERSLADFLTFANTEKVNLKTSGAKDGHKSTMAVQKPSIAPETV